MPKEGAEVARGWKNIFVIVVLAVGLSGCGTFQGQFLDESFWAGSPFHNNREAELGIAELAKGNYIRSEAHFKRALKGSFCNRHICGVEAVNNVA